VGTHGQPSASSAMDPKAMPAQRASPSETPFFIRLAVHIEYVVVLPPVKSMDMHRNAPIML
jgi:hypothetical protein